MRIFAFFRGARGNRRSTMAIRCSRLKAVLTMAHDVFISHSHVDKPAADAACAALEAKGIRCWIAPRDINPGQDWAASIVEAIRGAQIMLLVFSRHANQSPQVQREVERAANSGKALLPLRIEDVLPEAALEYYLNTPHWLDAITKPFEAHLEKLADACTSLLAIGAQSPDDASHGSASRRPGSVPFLGPPPIARRRSRLPVTFAVVAGLVVVLAAVFGVTAYLLRSAPARSPAPNPGSATSHTSAAAAPVPSPAPPAAAVNPGSADPRAQIVQLTGSWSDGGFVDAIVDRDIRIVDLYLKSGMQATTLSKGASAILFGFQGVPQNGDPVDMVKTFQANGFKVDDQLEDNYLMAKLGQNPVPFNTPLTPKGYDGGEGGKFVGTLLFWIVERATWNGANDQDVAVIKYLISQGADCKVGSAARIGDT